MKKPKTTKKSKSHRSFHLWEAKDAEKTLAQWADQERKLKTMKKINEPNREAKEKSLQEWAARELQFIEERHRLELTLLEERRKLYSIVEQKKLELMDS